MTDGSSDRVEVWRDAGGLWRWRMKAANHEIVAQGESYVRKQDVRDMLDQHFAGVPVVELEDGAA